jgi:hypothetical protein
MALAARGANGGINLVVFGKTGTFQCAAKLGMAL